MAQLDLLTLFAMATGLSMDAFAAAVCIGGSIEKLRPTQTLRLALTFGGFQGLMPLAGYALGRAISDYPWIADYDHWIAFCLLLFLGCKMIVEARFMLDEDAEATLEGDATKSLSLILLAIATSIDALAVGASLAFLRVKILLPSLAIGLTTALFAIIGARLGHQAGKQLGRRVEVLGGCVLILIGARILAEHLGWSPF